MNAPRGRLIIGALASMVLAQGLFNFLFWRARRGLGRRVLEAWKDEGPHWNWDYATSQHFTDQPTEPPWKFHGFYPGWETEFEARPPRTTDLP